MVSKKTKTAGIQVRSYNVGLGDCFLLTFQNDGRKRKVLIDFGSISGQTKFALTAIAENIAKETEKHLDLVVVSNDHQSHVNGFLSQRKVFDGMQIDHVWMGSFGAPNFYQSKAKKLKRAREYAKAFLARRECDNLGASLKTLIENNQPSTEQIKYLRNIGKGKPKVRYLTRKSRIKSPLGDNTEVEVLAPEPSQNIAPYFINSEFDYYDDTFDLDPISERLDSCLNPAHTKRHPLLKKPKFKNAECVEPPNHITKQDWRLLRKTNLIFGQPEMWSIDTIVNNLSLVLLFTIHGKTLLFPGDANEVSWNLALECRPLERCDFVKLAQFGAMPRNKCGWKAEMAERLLNCLDKNAKIMVSTKKGVYGAKYPIPHPDLLDQLENRFKDNLVRTDDDTLWVDVSL